MKLFLWSVMAAAVISGASVNAHFWGSALPALAVLFFAVDIIKPVLFAAGGVFRKVAIAAMVISATASTMFVSDQIGGSLGSADRTEERLAAIDGELAELRGGEGGDALSAALASAQADERTARQAEQEARALTARAETELRSVERRATAAEAAMHAPEACGPPEAPAEVGPTCRARRAEHASALNAITTAERSLADAQAAQRDAESATAAASRATATAASAAEQAAEASGRDADRVKALEAERRELAEQLDADDGAPGLATIAAWLALAPSNFSALIAVLAGVVAELFCTIAPAGLVKQMGAPSMPSFRLRAPAGDASSKDARSEGDASPTDADPQEPKKRSRAPKPPVKAAHGGARYSEADRATLTARARRLIEKGKSKAEAARELGVSQSTIKRWLSERAPLRAVK